MPLATIDPSESQRFELKSCEGAWVELRVMSYDAYLQRRDITTNIKFQSQGKGQAAQGELAMANQKVTLFEFKECIVDHNLEDPDGNKLDLSKSSSLRRLHPKIGEEIGNLIDEMNQLEDDDLEN